MNAKYACCGFHCFVIALFAGLSVTQAQTGAKADVVTAISNLEMMPSKPIWPATQPFYQKSFLLRIGPGAIAMEPTTPKPKLLKLMADTKNIKTNSEKLSELKVRVYGNTAVATYRDTYDLVIKGNNRDHTIIATDTFVKMGGEWKQVASHGSEGNSHLLFLVADKFGRQANQNEPRPT